MSKYSDPSDMPNTTEDKVECPRCGQEWPDDSHLDYSGCDGCREPKETSTQDDLRSAIEDAGDLGIDTYLADTGELVIELQLDQRRFRAFVSQVQEVED